MFSDVRIGQLLSRALDLQTLTTDGRDPNGIKAHALDVVKLVDDGKPISSAPSLIEDIALGGQRVGEGWGSV